MEANIKKILEYIGENPNREGLQDTPKRVVNMWKEMFKGYDKNQSPKITVFDNGKDGIVYDQMIIDSGDFYSNCEHHMVPFYGKAHIAYIPNDKVVGLSKLARCVEVFARRLQIQEQMTAQIADAIMENLLPQGVMVVIEAEHMCMTMRGIKKPGSKTITYVCRGKFEDDEVLKNRVLSLIK